MRGVFLLYNLAMCKAFVLLTMPLMFGVLASAQDDAQYQTLMKSIPASVAAIRNATDNAAAAPAAAKLADTFTQVAAFWKARNAEDAVKFAETARDAAKDIQAGTGDKAANLMKLQAQCGGCHMAHREGAAPNFKIK
jgi:mono/diheme cytochrome c family protein